MTTQTTGSVRATRLNWIGLAVLAGMVLMGPWPALAQATPASAKPPTEKKTDADKPNASSAQADKKKAEKDNDGKRKTAKKSSRDTAEGDKEKPKAQKPADKGKSAKPQPRTKPSSRGKHAKPTRRRPAQSAKPPPPSKSTAKTKRADKPARANATAKAKRTPAGLPQRTAPPSKSNARVNQPDPKTSPSRKTNAPDTRKAVVPAETPKKQPQPAQTTAKQSRAVTPDPKQTPAQTPSADTDEPEPTSKPATPTPNAATQTPPATSEPTRRETKPAVTPSQQATPAVKPQQKPTPPRAEPEAATSATKPPAVRTPPPPTPQPTSPAKTKTATSTTHAVSHRSVPDNASKAKPEPAPAAPVVARSTVEQKTADSVDQRKASKDPKTYYGLWVILPAAIAIILAMLTRQVIPALFLGVLAGAYMMLPCIPQDWSAADPNVSPIVRGFRFAVEFVFLSVIAGADDDFGRLKIIVFTLVIGFTVGVIGRNGGTAGLVRLVSGRSESPRRSALAAWLGGMVVFFDDYANTMIVGPTMRSVFDRAKLSRAKLAYIVDSTAAPVASLALIGTWIGAEIGAIQAGLNQITGDQVPAFLAGDGGGVAINGMEAFIRSLPYRFYPILALVFVFFVSLLRRDFGPMKKAEIKAMSVPPGTSAHDDDNEGGNRPKPRWVLGVLPVLVLVGVTVYLLTATGFGAMAGDTDNFVQQPVEGSTSEALVWHHIGRNEQGEEVRIPMAFWEVASATVSRGDSYLAMYHGALLSAIAALLLTALARACAVRDAVDAGLAGMSRMFPAIVVLILAWSLGTVLDQNNLQLGEVVAGHLEGFERANWLPLVVFGTAAAISFATGTAWATMAILCPMVVSIGAALLADLDPGQAEPLFYASIGSVLAGAVFGDHCSPISDTTVLSSMASGCRHEEHVWTQIPYALVTAVAAMGFGDVMCNVYKVPVYYGLGAGAVFLLVVLLIFGRTPCRQSRAPEVNRLNGARGVGRPSRSGCPIP